MNVIRTDEDIQAYCNLCEKDVDAVVRVGVGLLACAACLDERCRALFPAAQEMSISDRTAGLLVEKASKLAKAGRLGELQSLTDETDGPGGYIFGAWLSVALAWDDLDAERARVRHREEALIQLLRECLPAQECRSSLKRLDVWVNKQPLVDENGLGPDGVCLQCATASATDHAADCVFRPGELVYKRSAMARISSAVPLARALLERAAPNIGCVCKWRESWGSCPAGAGCQTWESRRGEVAAAVAATSDTTSTGALRAMVLRLADYLETATELLEEQEGDDDAEEGALADDFADARDLVARARALAADGGGQGGES